MPKTSGILVIYFLSIFSVAALLSDEGCPQSDECISAAISEENTEQTMLMQIGLEIQKASNPAQEKKANSSELPAAVLAEKNKEAGSKSAQNPAGYEAHETSEPENIGNQATATASEGPGGEADSEEFREATPVDMALGGSLMAFLCFVMGVFYTVNSQDADIRKVANFSLSNTISIFAAVLAYGCLDIWLSKVYDSQTYFTPKVGEILGRFITFFVLLVIVCMFIRAMNARLNMLFVRILGAHLVGFAAAEAFGTVQQEIPFGNNMFYDLCLAGICLIFLIVLEVVFLTFALGGSEELDEHREEFSDDFFGFSVGFLLAQFAKMTVLGHLTPIHGQPKEHSKKEVGLLGLWMAAALVALVTASMIKEKNSARNSSKFAQRWSGLAQQLCLFFFAWIGMFATQWTWFLEFPGHTISFGRMVLALLGSIVAMGAIYVLDGLVDLGAPKSLRTIINGFAVLIGLLWEQAFHEAIHSLSSGFVYPETCNTIMTVGIIILVLPAWRFYILPRASEDVEDFQEKVVEKFVFTGAPVRQVPQRPAVMAPQRIAMPRSVVVPPLAALGTRATSPTSTSISLPTRSPRYWFSTA
jgi:hypothetical protein